MNVLEAAKRAGLFLIILILGGVPTGLSASGAKALDADYLNQPLLNGVVVDSESGAAIRDVHILILENGRLLLSDSQGCFELYNLASGSYKVEFTHIRYKPVVKTLSVREGLPGTIHVRLEPLVRQTDPVLFSVPRNPSPSVHRITSSELKKSRWQDAGDAVRTVPGVQLLETGLAGDQKIVSIRGCKPNQVRVELNGVLLNTGTGASVDLSEFPVQVLDRIEVEPGSFQGSAGGTIRLFTGPMEATVFPQRIKTSVSSEVRQYDQKSVTLYSTLSGSKWQGWATYKFIDSENNFIYKDEQGAEHNRYNNSKERETGTLEFSRKFTRNYRISALVNFDRFTYGSPSPLYQSPTTEATSSGESNRAVIQLLPCASPRHKISASFSAFQNSRTYDSPEWQYNPQIGDSVYHVPIHIEDESKSYRSTLNATFQPAGAAYFSPELAVKLAGNRENFTSSQRYVSGNWKDRLDGDVTRSTIHGDATLSTQTKSSFITRMDLSGQILAHKTEHPGASQAISDWDQNITWNMKLSVLPEAQNHSVQWETFLSAGTGITIPAYTDMFLVESTFSRGNPNLAPEKTREVSSGFSLSWNPMAISLHNSLSAFYRKTDEMIVWSRNFRGQFFPDNLEKAMAYGMEALVNAETTDQTFSLVASITIQNVSNQTSGSPYKGNRVPFQPDWYGSAHMRIGSTTQSVNIESRYSGRRFTSESNSDPASTAGGGLGSYVVWDASVKQSFEMFKLDFEAYTGVQNLFDNKYELMERMPMPGRIWLAGATVLFDKKYQED